MDDIKYLLIIKDQQEEYLEYFNSLKSKSHYQVEILELKNFFAGKFDKIFKKIISSDLILAMDHGVFQGNEKEIRDYLDSTGLKPFTYFIFFHQDSEFLKHQDYVLGNKAGFILSDELSPLHWANFFESFLHQFYHKSILNYRLSDYIYHSFSGTVQSELLKRKNLEIEDLNKELEQRNRIDTLTQLYNRKALFDFLEKERDKTLRNKQRIDSLFSDKSLIEDKTNQKIKVVLEVYSVMMIDIDHFKQINDQYGHLVGDKVLADLGKLLQNKGIFRDHDFCARFGGEEFLVILPNTNSIAALEPANRLKQALEAMYFKSEKNEKFKITLSVGISQYYPQDKDNDIIIQRADKAMYYAKEHGRNQIIVYEDVFKSKISVR